MAQIITGNESLSAFASSSDIYKIPVPTRTYTESTIASQYDVGHLVLMDSAGAVTYTLIADGGEPFFTGQRLNVCWFGAGSTSIVPASGVTINGSASTVTLSARYSSVTLEKIGADAWMLLSENSTSGGGGGGGGSGDVTGPASAVNNRLAVFSGSTGKLIADGGSTISEAIAAAVAASASAGGGGSGALSLPLPYSFSAATTVKSLAHLPTTYVDASGTTVSYGIGDTFRTSSWDETNEDGSGALWRIVASTNLGVVGAIGYRSIYGTTIPGSPTVLTVLSAMGFVAGDTITANSNTVTFLASGASGNNQINVTDRLGGLVEKLAALLVGNLGDRVELPVSSAGIVISSADANGLISTASVVFSGTGVSKIGFTSATYTFASGLTMEGINWRFQMIPGAGGEIDVRSTGIVCDGVTVADYRKLRRVVSACAALGYKLVNNYGSKGNVSSSRMRISRTLDLRRCSCDLRIQAGTPIDAVTAAQDGNYFNEAAHLTYVADLAAWVTAGSNPDTEPVNPNQGIDVHSYVQWDATTRNVGRTVYAAGDASNSLSCRQYIDIRGDGNFDYTTRATCIGPEFSNDNACNGDYEARCSYVDQVAVLKDNLEKCRVKLSGTYVNYLGYLDPTGGTSPDTLRVEVHGQNFRHGIWEEEGSDTSVWFDVVVESRDDPGDGSPSFYLRNGKFSHLTGQMRALNGDLQILIDKSTNVGVDTVSLDLDIIHSHGCVLETRRCRNLLGHLRIKDCDGTNPIVWHKRLGSAGNFLCTIVANRAREAIRIGDIATTVHANGLYPIDCSLGTYHISSGTAEFPFLTNGDENVSTPFPTTLTALVVEKMKGGSMNFSQCVGNIEVLANCVASNSGDPVFFVPRAYAGGIYTTKVSTLANADFICLAGDTVTITPV